jgi:hypothetical protein
MRMRYAVILILLSPFLGAAFVLVKAPNAQATISSALVCEVLKTGQTSGAITAEGRQKLLSEMINSPTLDALTKQSAETAAKQC